VEETRNKLVAVAGQEPQELGMGQEWRSFKDTAREVVVFSGKASTIVDSRFQRWRSIGGDH